MALHICRYFSMFRRPLRTKGILVILLTASLVMLPSLFVFHSSTRLLNLEDDHRYPSPPPDSRVFHIVKPSPLPTADEFKAVHNTSLSPGPQTFTLKNDKDRLVYVKLPDVPYKRGVGFNKLYYNTSVYPLFFTEWLGQRSVQCDGKFVAYHNEVALVKDIILDNTKAVGRRGGEDYWSLMNQQESDEFFVLKPGFIQMNCDKIPQYKFFQNNHLNDWMRSISINKTLGGYDLIKDDAVYLAITRYEYVNLYHTMTDFYNAFLVTSFFNLTQSSVKVLIVDGHPWGSLDPVWNTLFSSVERLGHLPPRTLFKQLVFAMQGYNSPLFTGLSGNLQGKLPLAEEFREFFLRSYDLEFQRKLNCSRLNIQLIWRRNYVAHPRNPTGDVHRKIRNEEDLLQALRVAFKNDIIKANQTDLLDMRDQLKLTSEADILIGMHGAALSLTMVLPSHAALIELMPNYINPQWKKHFISMASWKKLIYKRWVNRDAKLEYPDHYTLVPPKIVINLINNVKEQMCLIKSSQLTAT